jgi:membrane-bound metal-dependent hydrolase YbcI (DUF457 family)
MDTITHGIAGALIAKAWAGGDDLMRPKPMTGARIVTWALMLGAIFPDSDVFRDMLSKDKLLVITWHRSLTHSWLMLPVFSLLLAWLVRAVARKFHWEAPSFPRLTAIFAAGLASHILLDLVTTFGTMIWSPLYWSRPAWDLIFIIDFTFSAILLLPQLLAWAHRDSKLAPRRAVMLWLLCFPVTLAIGAIARMVGAPIATKALLAVLFILSFLILGPAFRGRGSEITLSGWNRFGFFAACVYLALALFAHHRALERMRRFAEFQGVQPVSIGAMPLPPSFWRWDGLILVPRGVYQLRMDLSRSSGIPGADGGSDRAADFTYKYFPNAPMNPFIERARALPEVRKILWFDRFPVTRFRREGDQSIVEILDLRFPQIRPDRPAPFTYEVRFDRAGNVIWQGGER